MTKQQSANEQPVDRRSFLGGSAMALVGLAGAAQAQEAKPGAAKGEAAKPTAQLSAFIAGFDLKQAPPLAIERARTACIDTMGVMLAGSRSEPAALVLEMVKLEGATPAASIVGQSLRTSPHNGTPAVVLMVGVVKTLSRGQTIERFVLLSQPSLSPFIKKYVPITNTIGRLAPRLESAMRGVSILFVVLALCTKKQRAKISMRGMEFSNL